MRRWLAALTIAAASSLWTPAFAALTPSTSYVSANGLPDAPVTAIAEIGVQELAVGTTRGLRILRGRTFVAPEDADAMDLTEVREGRINAIARHRDLMWVATDGGLFTRETTGRWERQFADVGRTTDLHVARDGALYVGTTNGLLRIGSDGTRHTLSDTGLVTALGEDRLGRVWEASVAAITVHAQTGTITIDESSGLPSGEVVTSLVADGDDMLAGTTCAIETNPCGLVRIAADGSVVGVEPANPGTVASGVTALTVDTRGTLWIGLASGGLRGISESEERTMTVATGLLDDRVKSLAVDSEGNLWAGTETGLSRFTVSAWTQDPHQELQTATVTALAVLHSGTALVGTLDGIHRREDEWVDASDGLPSRVIRDILVRSDGSVVVATDGGLSSGDGTVWQPENRIPADDVHAVYEDADASLWVGTTQGVYRLGVDSVDRFSKEAGHLGQDIVTSVWAGADEEVWVGTLNGGASVWRSGAWTRVRAAPGGLADDIVLDGTRDADGNIWFATLGGVSRLAAGRDPHDLDAWTSYAAPDLAADRSNTIVASPIPNHIWVGTESGLSLIGPDAVTRFGTSDGISHPDIRTLAFMHNELWIGTAAGLTYHDDGRLPPSTIESEISWNGQPCLDPCAFGTMPHETRFITVEFTATDLGDIDGIRYNWTLTESDSHAVVSSGTTAASTEPIPVRPGSAYSLSVSAFDRDLNATSDTLPLAVDPIPWFHPSHPWFWFIVGGLVAIAVVLALNYRTISFALRAQRYDDVVLEIDTSPTGYSATSRSTGDANPSTLDVAESDVAPALVALDAPAAMTSAGDAVSQAFLDGGVLTPRLESGRPTRLRVRYLPAHELDAVPWELLRSPDAGFMAAANGFSVVRDLSDSHGDTRLTPRGRQLDVLVASAAPIGLGGEGEIAAEAREVSKGLSQSRGRVRGLEPLTNASVSSLASRLLVDGCDVLHFIGHGGQRDGAGVIYLEDRNGEAMSVSSSDLAPLLTSPDRRKRPRLVILTACRSGEAAEGVGSLAMHLVTDAGVPAVIGMGAKISASAGGLFSRVFYESLMEHGQVDYAVAQGRAELIATYGQDALAWATPRLYSRAKDGVIFSRGW